VSLVDDLAVEEGQVLSLFLGELRDLVRADDEDLAISRHDNMVCEHWAVLIQLGPDASELAVFLC
jgi:hypothetical protein